MKAAVYYQNGGPEVFHYKDVVDPGCGPDEVLIRVEAISVEGGDLVNRELRPLARVPHVAGVTDRRYGAIPGSAYWRHQMIGA